MARAASLLLRVVGLALVLVGLMGFALLGFDGTWTARTEIPAGRTAVLLEPSVVSVLGPRVTVRVEPADAAGAAEKAAPIELFLGRGRSDDLTAYAQDPKVSRVVGLGRSRELDVRSGPGPVAAPASGAAAAVAAPTDTNLPARWRPPAAVDLWQQQVSGPGARELSWRPTPGAQSIVVAAEQAVPMPALDVEVSWTDHTWLWIPSVALALGTALIVAGFLLSGGLPAGPGPLRSPPGGLRTYAPRRGSGASRAEGPPGGPADTPVAHASAQASAQAPASPPVTDARSGSDRSPAPTGSEASTDVVPATRRAARGRRRKQTVWGRARSRANAAAPAGAGAARAPRGSDEAERRGPDEDRS
jgi:hypothetical protein